MQVQVVNPEPRLIDSQLADAPTTRTLSPVDGITSAIVWFSYCGLVSAGITVMTW